MKNSDACPNFGNLKNIPESNIMNEGNRKVLSVLLKRKQTIDNRKGLEYIFSESKVGIVFIPHKEPLNVAQNAVSEINNYNDYSDFIMHYSHVCGSNLPPFKNEIKYFKDLKKRIDSLRLENANLMNRLEQREEELLHIQDERMELEKIVERNKKTLKTFKLYCEIDSKGENEIYMYGLAVPDNGNFNTDGAIISKNYYIISREDLVVTQMPMLLITEMYFHGEVPFVMKNGQKRYFNFYSKNPPKNQISKEEINRIKLNNEKYEDAMNKENSITKEIGEIKSRLQPMYDLELQYYRNPKHKID